MSPSFQHSMTNLSSSRPFRSTMPFSSSSNSCFSCLKKYSQLAYTPSGDYYSIAFSSCCFRCIWNSFLISLTSQSLMLWAYSNSIVDDALAHFSKCKVKIYIKLNRDHHSNSHSLFAFADLKFAVGYRPLQCLALGLQFGKLNSQLIVCFLISSCTLTQLFILHTHPLQFFAHIPQFLLKSNLVFLLSTALLSNFAIPLQSSIKRELNLFGEGKGYGIPHEILRLFSPWQFLSFQLRVGVFFVTSQAAKHSDSQYLLIAFSLERMNQQPSVNFIEPKYRFRIAQRIEKDRKIKGKIGESPQPYRLKLVSCDDKQQMSESKLIRPSALSLRKIAHQTDLKGKIATLRDDLNELETQIEVDSKRKSRIGNIRVLKTIQSEVEIGHSPSRLVLKPAWEIQPLSSKITKKKLQKIHTSRIHNYQQEPSPRYFPIVEKYAEMRQYYDSLPKAPIAVRYSTLDQKPLLSVVKRYHFSQTSKKFKKVCYVILFTIRLRTFNHLMRLLRKNYFDTYLQHKIESRLLDIKGIIIRTSLPFFNALINVKDYCGIVRGNEDKARRQKTRTIKRLVSLQVECLQDFVKQASLVPQLGEILYYLCKHGNYSCLYNLNTPQQLGLTCISEIHGYVSADRFLQQSALLSLLFLKLLLYNIFLQPENISNVSLTPLHCKNVKLAGNILYQIFIDIQDQFLEVSSGVYVIGNWEKLKNKFHFKTAQSITLQNAKSDGKQVISGLADHSYIRSIYETKEMHASKAIVRKCLQKIHQIIVKFHLQIKEKYFS